MPNYTTNFNLEKPLANEYFDIEIQNRNMDAIDKQLKDIDTKTANFIKIKGVSNFNGIQGIKIDHTIGNQDYFVYVTPLADPLGYLGEVWVEKEDYSFTVKCSGTTNVEFCYIVL